MTLNAVIALMLRFITESTDFHADYIKVVEDKPIMSVKYCLPVPVFSIKSLQSSLIRSVYVKSEIIFINVNKTKADNSLLLVRSVLLEFINISMLFM